MISGFSSLFLARVPGIRPLPSDREHIRKTCGGCVACCTTLAVEEIDKPGGQQCQHVCSRGCAIYDDRPGSCANYECMWLEGTLNAEEEGRPDKLGLVFSRWPNLSGFGSPVQGQAAPLIILCHELWPGAADKGTVGRSYLERITQEFLVQLVRTDGSVFLLPGWERHPELDRGKESGMAGCSS